MIYMYIYIVVVELSTRHAKFLKNRLSGSGEDFEGFLNIIIWTWWPSWSCDLDYFYTKWFPLLEMLHIKFDEIIDELRVLPRGPNN